MDAIHVRELDDSQVEAAGSLLACDRYGPQRNAQEQETCTAYVRRMLAAR